MLIVAFLAFNLLVSLKTSLMLTPKNKNLVHFWCFNGNDTWMVFVFKYRFENRMRYIFDLSESNGLTVFQNCLLPAMSL